MGRRDPSDGRLLVFVLAAVWLFVAVMMNRYGVVAAFMLALLLPACWPHGLSGTVGTPLRGVRGRLGDPSLPGICLLLLAVGLQCYTGWFYESNVVRRFVVRLLPVEADDPAFRYPVDDLLMYGWLKDHVVEDEGVLSTFDVSGGILLYTGRPVVLHPKFEVPEGRKRVRLFMTALFGNDEDALKELMESHKARHIVVPLGLMCDRSVNYYRYMFDRLTLRDDCLVYRLHFTPGEMKHFRLVYRNRFYQVFSLIKQDDAAKPGAFAYYPVYDGALCTVADGADGRRVLDDKAMTDVLARYKKSAAWSDAVEEMIAYARTAEALALARRAVTEGQPDGQVYMTASKAAVKAGQMKEAAGYAVKAASMLPGSAMPRAALAVICMAEGKRAEAIAHLNEAIEQEPTHLPSYIMAARIHVESGDVNAAIAIIDKATIIFPGNPELSRIRAQLSKLGK